MIKSWFKNNWPLVLTAVILAAVLLVRWPALAPRAPHIDEGMGIRAAELVLAGDWHYWPKNGHGPTLFYLGALVRSWVGINFLAFRLLMAVTFLLGLIILWLNYRPRLGKMGEWTLLLGLGLSSGLLFFSAYFIHEALFILFTILALVSFEKWFTTQKGFWFSLAVVSSGLMYMTKETALFTFAAWVVAGFVILAGQGRWKNFLYNLPYTNLIIGLIWTAVLYLLMFGFSLDLLKAPIYWLTERGLSLHVRPWYYFLALLAWHEIFLLGLSLVGAVWLTARRAWTARLLFFFLWFILVLAAYSLIPYKTPWLIMNMLLPLGLFLAFWVSEFLPTLLPRHRLALLAVAGVLLAASTTQLVRDNFIYPNQVSNFSYPYLQGGADFKQFLLTLEELNQQSLQTTGWPVAVQIVGQGDELLHVLTEKYDRRYAPFVPGLPVYINYQHDINKTLELLGSDREHYQRLVFKYFEPGPDIDLLIKQ
jgi:uncharacterized protein (TIGR03663 family)